MRSVIIEVVLAAFLTTLSLAAVPFTLALFMLPVEKRPFSTVADENLLEQ